ncbi:hypothetical protein HY008_01395 [Candidatus Woesebacteria bacterium]|nr:hypothetical protein [Candidatus Woesebacteria bacterium]
MKIYYSKHAEEKFTEESYVFKLRITKRLIKKIIEKPDAEDESRGEKLTVISGIDKLHSLIVVYRLIPTGIFIITFFPARKGRYESKILQRR